MKRLATAALTALTATVLLGGPVLASAPQPVTITVVTTTEGAIDPFEATGGVVCDNGVVENAGGRFIGWQSGTHAQILILKRFTCEDGTFDILLRVTLDFETADTVATWSVVDGTGAYASLRGAGKLTGTNDGGETILDVYVGGMHFN
jgi:hypothetical protein